jgi:hypothetical protein
VNSTFAILTPTGTTGAIAVIELSAPSGSELDNVLQRLSIGPLAIDRVSLKDLLGVDRGVVARWSSTVCHMMPHGGTGVVKRLAGRLRDAKLRQRSEIPHYPEANSIMEQRMLAALAAASSPLAIDLLLDQPRRWGSAEQSDPALDRLLDRLLAPPLVVALGRPNIGKSSLVNALAGSAVSIVADEPGTTRDHVGVMLNIGGLVIRYLDTPGLRENSGAIEEEARALSLHAAEKADLLLLMGDSTAPPPLPPLTFQGSLRRIALRKDLGEASWTADIRVSARTGENLSNLAGMIREVLVPQHALDNPRPWRFWKDSATTTATWRE